MALKWPIMCWCAVKKLLTHSLTHSRSPGKVLTSWLRDAADVSSVTVHVHRKCDLVSFSVQSSGEPTVAIFGFRVIVTVVSYLCWWLSVTLCPEGAYEKRVHVLVCSSSLSQAFESSLGLVWVRLTSLGQIRCMGAWRLFWTIAWFLYQWRRQDFVTWGEWGMGRVSRVRSPRSWHIYCSA